MTDETTAKAKAPAKPALKKLPPVTVGVSETSGNIRMIKMVRPSCPVPTDVNHPDFDAEVIPCNKLHRGKRGWWEHCEEAGHNPYFHDERGKSMPNVAQVAQLLRINSGMGVQKAKAKGFKLLTEVGYEPVCEYRNCYRPVEVKTVYGDFCSERQAKLIAVDVENIDLEVHPDLRMDREKQLRAVPIYDKF